MTSSYRDKDFGQSVVLKKNNKFRLSGGVIDAPDKRLPFFHGSPILIYNRTGLIKNTLNSTGVRNNYGAQLDYANVIFWELYCFRYYRVASWRQLGEGEGGWRRSRLPSTSCVGVLTLISLCCRFLVFSRSRSMDLVVSGLFEGSVLRTLQKNCCLGDDARHCKSVLSVR
jgi:hypothetical protein